MIYTITCNPAVDYYMQYRDALTPGKTASAEHVKIKAGGKGINCSIVLHNLGIESTVLSFAGGKSGSYIREALQQYPLIHDESIAISEASRINVKVMADKDEYILNARGPVIPKEAQDKLLGKLNHLTKDDWVMLCGKSAEGIDVRFIYEIADLVSDAGAKLVLDTTDCRLEDLTYCEPFLIKPNMEEFSALVGRQVSLQTGREEMARVRSKGVENILLTLGSEGAFFSGTDGNRILKSPEVHVVSTNGAGDCALAAFVGIYAKTGDTDQALKYAMAAGTAAVCVEGMPERESIETFVSRIQMEKI